MSPASWVVLVACAVVLAACASSQSSGHTATIRSASPRPQALAYSRCMRSHGVTNFPDPSANGQLKIASNSGINLSSRAFNAAQSACRKLSGSGLTASGPSTPHIMALFLAFSNCMRAHGITNFPDPTTSPPPPAPGRTVSNDGVYLFIPVTTDVNSPLYKSASVACRPHPG